jgi:hypothetical protein
MRERFTDHPERFKTAAGVRREIPDDFKYNPKKLKHLKKILHNVTISLGTLTSSINEFAKLKGPEVSPDGLLGGVGYIMPLKEIKETFNTTVRGLSDIADSLADELTNPRWEVKEDKEVKKLIKEKEEAIKEVEEAEEDINPNELVTVEDIKEDVEDKETKPEKESPPDLGPDPDNKEQIESKELRNASVTGEDKLASAVRESLKEFYIK